ncbi:MAG: hypothetical protein JNJ54_08740 [Myxococcaceae bacterium]|nr:hypothetical protein [Myxococcaceae bacterium]
MRCSSAAWCLSRLALGLLLALPTAGCSTTVSLRGSALASLRAGQDDAFVLEPAAPVGPSEAPIRFEPSSRLRFSTTNGVWTEWVQARELRLFDRTVSWGERWSGGRLRLEHIADVEIATFSRGLTMLWLLGVLVTGGIAAIFAPEDDRSFPGERLSLDSPERLFTERAVRVDNVRGVVAQEVGMTVGAVPDLFTITRVGLLMRDFAELSLGLRLLSPDVLLRVPSPLVMRQLFLRPGVFGRFALIGAFDPEHRVALLVGGELGFDPLATVRLLWGVRVRPAGQLHLTLLPLTPLFSSAGTAWGISLDTGWHF